MLSSVDQPHQQLSYLYFAPLWGTVDQIRCPADPFVVHQKNDKKADQNHHLQPHIAQDIHIQDIVNLQILPRIIIALPLAVRSDLFDSPSKKR